MIPVTNSITSHSGLFINGSWLNDGKPLEVIDKYSGEAIAQVKNAMPIHVDAAISSAEHAMNCGILSVRKRFETLCQVAGILEAKSDEIINTYIAETGFTLSDATTELQRACNTLRLSAEEALKLSGEVVPVGSAYGHDRRLAFTILAPIGVVCAIAPFNAPLNTVVHKIAPAIAAGNAVVLKPAAKTPLCSVLLCEAFSEAGLPPGYLNLVIGEGSTVGRQLVEDKRIRYFTFTGSTNVGLFVKQRSGIAKTHLELGSNSATIVCKDADLELAAELIVTGGYRKAGQVCTSVQRLLLDNKIAKDLQDLLVERITKLRLGDPHLPETDVGPMISLEAAGRAFQLVNETIAAGATCILGGTSLGSLFEPTLIINTPQKSALMKDEVFAPVIVSKSVAGLKEAVEIANDSDYGLQAGIFTNDIDAAFWAANNLQVGGVMVNDTSSYHADLMPYGGVKASGYGTEGPHYAARDMSVNRIVVFNLKTPQLTDYSQA